jgi:microcystin-dependent protein
MSEPFIGEIRPFSFNFPPRGWALCSGQLLPINQNQALFSLLGTTYGGNGTTNFALPNLNDRTARGEGTGPGLAPHFLGESGGSQTQSLALSQIPAHSHGVKTASSATSNNPAGAIPATAVTNVYGAPDADLNANVVSSAGGGQPHKELGRHGRTLHWRNKSRWFQF